MHQDIIEIEQLLYRYCHALDRGTIDDFIDAFHRDAVFMPRYQSSERISGREAIRDWFLHYNKTIRAAHRHRRKLTSPWIHVYGNEANAVCYVDADSVSKSTGDVFIHAARYEDKLVKEEDRWWIIERVINVDERSYTYPVGRAS